jgi:threonine synthase
VVEGRLEHAGAAFRDALAAHEDWQSTATFDTPYRHEGKKTMGYELIEQLDWSVPDAVVYPTGGGVGLIGIHKAAIELRALGLIDDIPGMYAAQSTGCAPIVEAWEAGRADIEAWETPDTICGGIEVPNPGAASWVLEAMRESDGGAVATADDDILESAAVVAQQEGLEMGATPAAAASGAWALAKRDEFAPDATIVIINTGAGNKDADIVRSHLMGQGV